MCADMPAANGVVEVIGHIARSIRASLAIKHGAFLPRVYFRE